MTRLNFNVDEATLLKTYQLSSLRPQTWEEVDYELLGENVSVQAGDEVDHVLYRAEREDLLGLGDDLDVAAKSTLLVTSKAFSPSQYLSYAHPNATYHDLVRGAEHLERSLEAREEALKMLVEDTLDSFVSVKSTVDSLCTVMRQEILAPDTGHATLRLRRHLKVSGAQRANQIFLPVLETASKAQKLRTTLGVFERSRFFFNLPSFIMESIDAGKYDLALRDYKKGKYLLENRPNQLLPIATADPSTQLLQQQQQRRILNKVWANVERAMDEMCKVLVARLEDSRRSLEEQEKTLVTIMELQSTDKSAWTYFDSHHTYIMGMMSSAYRAGVTIVEKTQQIASSNLPGPSEAGLESQLRTAMRRLESKQPELVLSKSSGDSTWHAILGMVQSISEAILTTLPTFWKISERFMNGKYRKANRVSEMGRNPTQCRTMAYDIVKLYVSLISQAFKLSEVVMASNSSDLGTHDLPPLFPRNSHSLATAYYLQKVLNEVQDCVVELEALNISDQVSAELKNLVEGLRWRFMDVLVHDWIRDAGIFYHLESWVVTSNDLGPRSASSLSAMESTSTHLLHYFELFQRHITTAMYKLSSDSHQLPLKSAKAYAAGKQPSALVMGQAFVKKITQGFLDAVYHFLDGLMVLVSDEAPLGYLEPEGSLLLENGTSLCELVDIKDSSIRLLIVIANLIHFGKYIVPGMVTELESIFGTSLVEDRKTLDSVIEELDKTLFEACTRPRVIKIKEELHDSILGGQVDWSRIGQPDAIRQYAYEIMNYLVDVHAQVCSISPSLLDRTLNALINELVKEASKSFQKIRRFGTGGLLLAVMEMTFMHKSLGYYGRDTSAGKAMEDIYIKQIPKAYAPSSKDADFRTSFDVMQKVLAEARRTTGVQFLCFRKMNLKEKDGSGTDNGKRKNRSKRE
ncbi:exocyst complex component Sec5-domain-containing protein [Gymnopilus junonius]|uniref:Exocyst complex component SEC5 n=1 Tax=Gymnopilus junonius TaxID=109634 RepID=A0A9P5NZ00_GYMJU|nr:exocyst complex component Sec5-domain-containing protein [Gymnopilus junonius]